MTVERELTRLEDQGRQEGLIVAGTVELPVSIDQAVEQWNQYQELVRRLLDASDYQTIQGRKFTKKSAWRKLARAFNIADQIVERHITREEATGRGIEAEFLVRATAPNGRYADGWASCSIYERAHEDDKTDYKGKVTCKGPCNGRKHFSNPDHDVPATAHTRAKNRAIADLIGAGEVSAEEMGRDEAPSPSRKKAKPRAKKKAPPTTTTPKNGPEGAPAPSRATDGEISSIGQLWTACHNILGLKPPQVRELMGFEVLQEWLEEQGLTPQEGFEAIKARVEGGDGPT